MICEALSWATTGGTEGEIACEDFKGRRDNRERDCAIDESRAGGDRRSFIVHHMFRSRQQTGNSSKMGGKGGTKGKIKKTFYSVLTAIYGGW